MYCLDIDPVTGARCERPKGHEYEHRYHLRAWPNSDTRPAWRRWTREHQNTKDLTWADAA